MPKSTIPNSGKKIAGAGFGSIPRNGDAMAKICYISDKDKFVVVVVVVVVAKQFCCSIPFLGEYFCLLFCACVRGIISLNPGGTWVLVLHSCLSYHRMILLLLLLILLKQPVLFQLIIIVTEIQ